MIEQSAEQAQRLQQSQRTLTDRTASGAGAAALAKLLAQYKKLLPDLPPREQFDKLLKDLKKDGASAEQIKKQLEETFPEPSHRHAALAFLEESLSNDRGRSPQDDELLKQVRTAQHELDQKHGPEIRAALNVSAHAAERPDLGTLPELREFYRQSVVGYANLNQAYDAIMTRYGSARFSEAVDFLITSLGHDVGSHEPSRDAAELKATLDDLYFVQVARNSFEAFGGLLGKMQKQFGVGADMDAHSVMKDVLSLKDQRFVDPEKIQSLTDRVGARDHEPRIYFQRELHTLVRRMPDKIFQNADERLKLADGVQAALDRSIQEEGF
jgi:type III secretion protein W